MKDILKLLWDIGYWIGGWSGFTFGTIGTLVALAVKVFFSDDENKSSNGSDTNQNP
jgi:hypothetical protein